MNIPTFANGSVQRRFMHDPAHGWLRVPLSDLDELGIRNQITAYSYLDDRFAYLEEDCDYETYINAMTEAGISVIVKQAAGSSGPSSIRRKRSFDAPTEGPFAKLYANPQFHH